MTQQAASRDKQTIVIVDDEQPILTELKILLGRTYNIHTFVNPEEVEPFVDQNKVDMIISDEMMPEMRGSALLAVIHEKHPDICNIVLSGQAEKDDIVRAVNEGHIFSFLYKPVERQQLLHVIQNGLENRNMKLMLAEQNIKLKEYNDNLEQMVAEKTAQLVKAYDRLKMLDADKMSFLIYLSQEMDSSLDRIQKLAEALLNYFAFAGREIRVNRTPVSLKALLQELLQEADREIKQAGIELKTTVSDDLKVLADPDTLKTALRTIIDNARIFTPEGGKITISGESADGRVRLCVADTGQGIAPENLEKIFTAFAIDRANRHPDGFGLNLPMARTIINAQGGGIRAESEGPGKGTRFYIELDAAS